MTTQEEKQRIDCLELFDEYEPWHQKCTHYLIISATKGEHLTKCMLNLYDTIPRTIQPNVAPETNEITSPINLKPFDIKFGTRFGHSVCFARQKLFLFGGFGEMVTDLSGKHMRHCSFEILNFENKSIKCLNQVIDPNNLIGIYNILIHIQMLLIHKLIHFDWLEADRIFHTTEVWQETQTEISLLIVFGRSNPSKIFDSIVKVKVSIETEEIISMEKVKESNEISRYAVKFECMALVFIFVNFLFVFRFRHGSCIFSDSRLFIYGGKIVDEKSNVCVLNDILLIDDQFNVKQLNVKLFV